jgi:hypothetical protein
MKNPRLIGVEEYLLKLRASERSGLRSRFLGMGLLQEPLLHVGHAVTETLEFRAHFVSVLCDLLGNVIYGVTECALVAVAGLLSERQDDRRNAPDAHANRASQVDPSMEIVQYFRECGCDHCCSCTYVRNYLQLFCLRPNSFNFIP